VGHYLAMLDMREYMYLVGVANQFEKILLARDEFSRVRFFRGNLCDRSS